MVNGSLKYDKTGANKNTRSSRGFTNYWDGVHNMGELIFIKNGQATTIHDDGSTTSIKVDKCDQCGQWANEDGGLSIRDVGQEIVIWLCAQCRE